MRLKWGRYIFIFTFITFIILFKELNCLFEKSCTIRCDSSRIFNIKDKNTWLVHFCLFCLNAIFSCQDDFTLIQLFPMCSIPFCEQHFFGLGFVSLNSFASNIFRYYLPFPIACSSNFCCRSYLFILSAIFFAFFEFCLLNHLFVKSFGPSKVQYSFSVTFYFCQYLLISCKLFIMALFSQLFS